MTSTASDGGAECVYFPFLVTDEEKILYHVVSDRLAMGQLEFARAGIVQLHQKDSGKLREWLRKAVLEPPSDSWRSTPLTPSLSHLCWFLLNVYTELVGESTVQADGILRQRIVYLEFDMLLEDSMLNVTGAGEAKRELHGVWASVREDSAGPVPSLSQRTRAVLKEVISLEAGTTTATEIVPAETFEDTDAGRARAELTFHFPHRHLAPAAGASGHVTAMLAQLVGLGRRDAGCLPGATRVVDEVQELYVAVAREALQAEEYTRLLYYLPIVGLFADTQRGELTLSAGASGLLAQVAEACYRSSRLWTTEAAASAHGRLSTGDVYRALLASRDGMVQAFAEAEDALVSERILTSANLPLPMRFLLRGVAQGPRLPRLAQVTATPAPIRPPDASPAEVEDIFWRDAFTHVRLAGGHVFDLCVGTALRLMKEGEFYQARAILDRAPALAPIALLIAWDTLEGDIVARQAMLDLLWGRTADAPGVQTIRSVTRPDIAAACDSLAYSLHTAWWCAATMAETGAKESLGTRADAVLRTLATQSVISVLKPQLYSTEPRGVIKLIGQRPTANEAASTIRASQLSVLHGFYAVQAAAAILMGCVSDDSEILRAVADSPYKPLAATKDASPAALLATVEEHVTQLPAREGARVLEAVLSLLFVRRRHWLGAQRAAEAAAMAIQAARDRAALARDVATRVLDSMTLELAGALGEAVVDELVAELAAGAAAEHNRAVDAAEAAERERVRIAAEKAAKAEADARAAAEAQALAQAQAEAEAAAAAEAAAREKATTPAAKKKASKRAAVAAISGPGAATDDWGAGAASKPIKGKKTKRVANIDGQAPAFTFELPPEPAPAPVPIPTSTLKPPAAAITPVQTPPAPAPPSPVVASPAPAKKVPAAAPVAEERPVVIEPLRPLAFNTSKLAPIPATTIDALAHVEIPTEAPAAATNWSAEDNAFIVPRETLAVVLPSVERCLARMAEEGGEEAVAELADLQAVVGEARWRLELVSALATSDKETKQHAVPFLDSARAHWDTSSFLEHLQAPAESLLNMCLQRGDHARAAEVAEHFALPSGAASEARLAVGVERCIKALSEGDGRAASSAVSSLIASLSPEDGAAVALDLAVCVAATSAQGADLLKQAGDALSGRTVKDQYRASLLTRTMERLKVLNGAFPDQPLRDVVRKIEDFPMDPTELQLFVKQSEARLAASAKLTSLVTQWEKGSATPAQLDTALGRIASEIAPPPRPAYLHMHDEATDGAHASKPVDLLPPFVALLHGVGAALKEADEGTQGLGGGVLGYLKDAPQNILSRLVFELGAFDAAEKAAALWGMDLRTVILRAAYADMSAPAGVQVKGRSVTEIMSTAPKPAMMPRSTSFTAGTTPDLTSGSLPIGRSLTGTTPSMGTAPLSTSVSGGVTTPTRRPAVASSDATANVILSEATTDSALGSAIASFEKALPIHFQTPWTPYALSIPVINHLSRDSESLALLTALAKAPSALVEGNYTYLESALSHRGSLPILHRWACMRAQVFALFLAMFCRARLPRLASLRDVLGAPTDMSFASKPASGLAAALAGARDAQNDDDDDATSTDGAGKRASRAIPIGTNGSARGHKRTPSDDRIPADDAYYTLPTPNTATTSVPIDQGQGSLAESIPGSLGGSFAAGSVAGSMDAYSTAPVGSLGGRRRTIGSSNRAIPGKHGSGGASSKVSESVPSQAGKVGPGAAETGKSVPGAGLQRGNSEAAMATTAPSAPSIKTAFSAAKRSLSNLFDEKDGRKRKKDAKDATPTTPTTSSAPEPEPEPLDACNLNAVVDAIIEVQNRGREGQAPVETRRFAELLVLEGGSEEKFFAKVVELLVGAGRYNDALEIADTHLADGAPDYLLKMLVDASHDKRKSAEYILRIRDRSAAAGLVLRWLSSWPAEKCVDLLHMCACHLAADEPQRPKVEKSLSQIKLFIEILEVSNKWADWQSLSKHCHDGPRGVISILVESGQYALARRVATEYGVSDMRGTIEEAYSLFLLSQNETTRALQVLESFGESAAAGDNSGGPVAVCQSLLTKLAHDVPKSLLLVDYLLHTKLNQLAPDVIASLKAKRTSLLILQSLPPIMHIHVKSLPPRVVAETLLMGETTTLAADLFKNVPELVDDEMILTYVRKALDTTAPYRDDDYRFDLHSGPQRPEHAGDGPFIETMRAGYPRLDADPDAPSPVLASHSGLVMDVGNFGTMGKGMLPPPPTNIGTWLSGDESKDKVAREKHFFRNAPSVSLAKTLLAMCSSPAVAANACLQICDELSRKLTQQKDATRIVVPEASLIIDLIQRILFHAKDLFTQANGNGMDVCDVFISHIELLQTMISSRCRCSASLADLSDPGQVRMLRDNLISEDRLALAMDVATKCRIETEPVWASWGLNLLQVGRYSDAREKFRYCMNVTGEGASPIAPQKTRLTGASPFNTRLLSQIVETLEAKPAIRADALTKLYGQLLRSQGPKSKSKAKDADNDDLSVESYMAALQINSPSRATKLLHRPAPKNISAQSNLDQDRLDQCVYYLSTYGSPRDLVAFFSRHGLMSDAVRTAFDTKLNPAVFFVDVVEPAIKTRRVPNLLHELQRLDPELEASEPFLIVMCRHLHRLRLHSLLYDVQVFMKDHVRAGLTCVNLFMDATRVDEKIAQLQRALERFTESRDSLASASPKPRAKQAAQSAARDLQQGQVMNLAAVEEYVRRVELQLEVTRFLGDNFVKYKGTDGTQLTLFGTRQDKCQLAEEILVLDRFDIAFQLINQFRLPASRIYQQAMRKLAADKNIKVIENMLRNFKGMIPDDEWDTIVMEGVTQFASPGNDVKLADKLIPKITDPTTVITAHIMTKKLKTAYLEAVKRNHVLDLQRIRAAAIDQEQPRVAELCEKYLQKLAGGDAQ